MQAIIISDNHYNGLGVIRSLGEKGIKIILILLITNKNTYIDKSKYVNITYKCNHNDDEIFNIIRKHLNNEENNILFPLSDYAAIFCDKYYDILINKHNIIVPHAKGKLLEYENKMNMAIIASKFNIITPSHFILNLININKNELSYPLIIKPLLSINGKKSDIKTVNNEIEYNNVISYYKKNNYKKVMVEEYITSDDSYMLEIMGYVTKNGDVYCGPIVKKIREYPINNGSTSYACFLHQHSCIDIQKIVEFVKYLNFYGVFDIEFKYSNGIAYFIEINFRNGAPSYSLTNIGFNIIYNWYCDACNIRVKNNIKIKNKFFMCEQIDIINCLKGEINIIKWIYQYITSKKIFFNIHDTLPVLFYYKSLFVYGIKRILKI